VGGVPPSTHAIFRTVPTQLPDEQWGRAGLGIAEEFESGGHRITPGLICRQRCLSVSFKWLKCVEPTACTCLGASITLYLYALVLCSAWFGDNRCAEEGGPNGPLLLRLCARVESARL
jgi:hypothetical protein